MDYQKFKKNIKDFCSDLVHKPFRTVIVLLVFLVIYVFSILGPIYIPTIFTHSNIQKEELGQYLNIIATSSQINLLGLRTENITENTSSYTIKAKYPVFGVADIDSHIRDLINNEIIVSKNDETGEVYDFESSFDQPYIDNNLISIRLIFHHSGKYMQGIEKIIGINYNRKTGKFYSVNDVDSLTDLTFNQLAVIARKQIEDRNGVGSAWYIPPVPDTFSTFLINNKTVTFIFQRYQVTAGANGEQEVVVNRAK